jgi:hypothetical protein
MKSMEILVEMIFSLAGKTKNTNKDKEMAIAGLSKNISLFEAPGIVFSFLNSLIASLNGCRTPANLTLFGPLRS